MLPQYSELFFVIGVHLHAQALASIHYILIFPVHINLSVQILYFLVVGLYHFFIFPLFFAQLLPQIFVLFAEFVDFLLQRFTIPQLVAALTSHWVI